MTMDHQKWLQIAIRFTYPPVSSNTAPWEIPELNEYVLGNHIYKRIFLASHVWLPKGEPARGWVEPNLFAQVCMPVFYIMSYHIAF